jgi:hypothetical protein
MDAKKVIVLGVICVLVGVLIGYLLWGQRTQRLLSELGGARARLEQLQIGLAEETQRAKDRGAQLEARLKQAESQLGQATEDLRLERQRRVKLELLISQGRK